MTPFEKQAYADMSSIDRIRLFMIKAEEFMQFCRIMTEEDVQGLKRICDLMKEDA